MTEDDIVTLGHYCEDLLSQDFFNMVVQQFNMQCYQQFISTDPKAKMEREGVFAQMRGLQDFLDHVKAIVEQKNAIEQRNALSPEDAHIEGID